MEDQSSEWKPLETGGVLMGYIATNGDVVVTDIIGPGDNAIHKKYSFYPDQDFQLKKIERIYFESSKSNTYLGDWHSHPHSKPSLSNRDKKTLGNIASDQGSQNNNPVMVVLGSHPDEWTVNSVQFISVTKKYWWPFNSYNIDILNNRSC